MGATAKETCMFESCAEQRAARRVGARAARAARLVGRGRGQARRAGCGHPRGLDHPRACLKAEVLSHAARRLEEACLLERERAAALVAATDHGARAHKLLEGLATGWERRGDHSGHGRLALR